MLAQIPDGAFRDLMVGELDRLTGVQIHIGEMPNAPTPRRSAHPAQRSLVRSAVALLVQNPQVASAIEPPWTFAELRQPGIPLLVELIAFCRDRPDITTGALLEHFAEREEARALQKLATIDFPGGEGEARAEFVDALGQLEKQTTQQRIDELHAKHGASELTDAEKAELRALLASKGFARKP
jgi:DNA primase